MKIYFLVCLFLAKKALIIKGMKSTKNINTEPSYD